MTSAKRAARLVYLLVLAVFAATVLVTAPVDFAKAGAVLVAVMVVHIAGHELGHAVAARAMGYRVVRIVTGIGPVLLAFRVGDTLVELRLIPMGGHILPAARHPGDTNNARWRELVTTAAGPLATLAMILAAPALVPADFLLVAEPDSGDFAERYAFGDAFVRIGWWLLIGNLVPWKSSTDGAVILRLLTGSDRSVAEHADLRGAAEAMHHIERGDLDAAIASSADYGDNSAAAAMHAAALSRAGRFVEARDVLVSLVDDVAALPTERQLVVANNLAWVDVQLGEPHLVGEADAWSAFAERLLADDDPNRAAVMSTRAHVLSATGRVLEADACFAEALAGKLDVHSRAEVHAGRARHRLANGDALGAREDADRALALAPDAPVVRAVVGIVDNMSLTVVAEQLRLVDGRLELPDALRARSARATLRAAGRAAAGLDQPEPLLTHAAAGLECSAGTLHAALVTLLAGQAKSAKRSSIQATSSR